MRIVVVASSCAVATMPTTSAQSFFNGVFVLTAGYCYDYFNFLQQVDEHNTIASLFGKVAFFWSFFLCLIALFGVLQVITFDSSTLMITSSNWLMPSTLHFRVDEFAKILWSFVIFAALELLCGRNDPIDKKWRRDDI